MSQEQYQARPSYCPPHGGACDTCGEVKPDVYVNSDGNNTCPSCDQYDADRWFEFREEKIQSWQIRKGGQR